MIAHHDYCWVKINFEDRRVLVMLPWCCHWGLSQTLLIPQTLLPIWLSVPGLLNVSHLLHACKTDFSKNTVKTHPDEYRQEFITGFYVSVAKLKLLFFPCYDWNLHKINSISWMCYVCIKSRKHPLESRSRSSRIKISIETSTDDAYRSSYRPIQDIHLNLYQCYISVIFEIVSLMKWNFPIKSCNVTL